jgi:alkyl sulfatase BDS1-like metallo-beta-lactamase superfamily hydrolase
MSDVLELADRAWRGEVAVEGLPTGPLNELTEVAPDIAFVPSMANVTAVDTPEGLVLIDTGGWLFARDVHTVIRRWRDSPLHTAVYSHGHIDHVFGVSAFDEEAAARGWATPQVVAHEGVPARFDRYRLTAGYNAAINRRQFGVDDLAWPTDYRYPDHTYRDRLDLDVGEVRFELHHTLGETDDHTWTWVPSRRVLCPGDLFIWCAPNAGNPQKVQRYPREWAAALRTMADCGAELMLPGHGLPIVGANRVRSALDNTATLLESLHDQTVALMNAGARLDEIVHTVEAPAHLLDKPYLRPIYDDPEFVVRNTWRLYGGWFDGNPAHLKPAPDAALAAEIAALCGGADRLAERARQLAEAGALRLAGHLAEYAALAAPGAKDAHAARATVNELRAEAETSLMASALFAWAARESHRAAENADGGPPA